VSGEDQSQFLSQTTEHSGDDGQQSLALINLAVGVADIWRGGRAPDPRVERTLCLLRQHYPDSSFSLKMVSLLLNISEDHLGRLFKRQTNVTFRRYLVSIRIEHAKDLLTTSNHGVIYVPNL
jgi:transcriptional regulator GlxA family with amidase domain